MFETKARPLLPMGRFVLRLLRTFLIAVAIVISAMGIGILGYHHFEHLSWLDAALNAAMILTGMGPVNQVQTEGGKYFAIFYSLFSGVIFLTVAAVLFGPVAHRLIHRFHLQLTDDDEDEGSDTQGKRS